MGAWRGMGRRRKLALLALACVAALAVVAWLARPRDEPSRATVDEAVRSFRAERASARGEGRSGEAAPGVYRYATRGAESVQTPFFGTSHDYDGVSTIVVSAGHCGQRERWQVLDGRWTEAEACTADGRTSATVTEFHEFFDTAQKDSFHCRGPAVSELPTLRPGARFSSACESEDSSIANRSRIVGVERVRVGAESFAATRIETRSEFGGENSGAARRQEWRRRSDGLLLRRSVGSEADNGRAGGTHYSERYTIRLLSTTPKR